MSGATLDGADAFNRMLGDLVNIGGPGTNVDAAFRGEAGALLGVCADYTPSATVKKIRERADYRFASKYSIRGSGDLKVTMNDGSRGGEAVADRVWLRSGGKFHIMRGPGAWGDGGTFKRGPKKGQTRPARTAPGGARWPDRIWNEYQSLIDQTPEERAALKKAWIEAALKSRGLAKASWFQIGAALGLPMKTPAGYVMAAIGSDGRAYVNGTGTHRDTKTETILELINLMPALTGGGLDGEGIAERAKAARVSAFDHALEHGIFADLDQVAKRYPGLLAVTP